jgi:hypothetical protein
MKTLKCEEVYRNEYRDFEEARASLKEFLERVYNQKRLHSESRISTTGRVRKRRRMTEKIYAKHAATGAPVEYGAGASQCRTFPAPPHRTARAVFPHPALRSSSSDGLRRNPSKWLTLPTI